MDEIELTDRLATDLDAAFEAFVRAHQDRCYSVAFRLIGNAHDAEEVAQDAFVRAYRALGSYEPERIRALQPRAWLATIVVNLARNRLRGRRPATIGIEADATGSLRDPTPGPDAAAASREEANRWSRLLGTLPDRYRIPIVLRHVDELSYPEMASVLDRPEGTIKAQVHRGIAMLREAYTAEERAGGGTTNDHRTGARTDARIASNSPSDPSPKRLSARAPRLEAAR